MKILIQSMVTSLFLAMSGDWTPDTDSAMEFEDGYTAIEYSCKRRLHNTALSYRFGDPRYNFSIPTADDGSPPDSKGIA